MKQAVMKEAAGSVARDAKNKISQNFNNAAKAAKDSKWNPANKGAKAKGRPSLRKEEEKQEERRFAPEVRSIELWNRKLENMLTVLEAGAEVSSK